MSLKRRRSAEREESAFDELERKVPVKRSQAEDPNERAQTKLKNPPSQEFAVELAVGSRQWTCLLRAHLNATLVRDETQTDLLVRPLVDVIFDYAQPNGGEFQADRDRDRR